MTGKHQQEEEAHTSEDNDDIEAYDELPKNVKWIEDKKEVEKIYNINKDLKEGCSLVIKSYKAVTTKFGDSYILIDNHKKKWFSNKIINKIIEDLIKNKSSLHICVYNTGETYANPYGEGELYKFKYGTF